MQITISDAIKHCDDMLTAQNGCYSAEKEQYYKQLKEWLTELESYRAKRLKSGDVSRKIERIADNYGYKDQSQIAIEECSELIKALSKHNRRTGNTTVTLDSFHHSESFRNVVEETADVQIMLLQITYLLGINDDVNEIISEKLNRQIKRIEAGQ